MARPLLLEGAMRRPRYLVATLLVACSSGDPTDRDADSIVPAADGGAPQDRCAGVTLDVGTGARAFEPVPPGSTVYLFTGPQGGSMFYISVRARVIDATDARMCYAVYLDGGDATIGAGCWNTALTNDLGDGVHERIALLGQLDPQYHPVTGNLPVRGHDVRVAVTLSDMKGCSADGGWSAHVDPDPPPN